jgi:hypothetical protein
MNGNFLFYQIIHPEANPDLFYDDQPVGSLIYLTEKEGQPSPADIIPSHHSPGMITDILPQLAN